MSHGICYNWGMGDVIQFKAKTDFVNCTYFDVDGKISLSMRDESIQVIWVNKDEIEFVAFGKSHVFKREELAEFLQVARVLIDSEDKWLPQYELIGFNYE